MQRKATKETGQGLWTASLFTPSNALFSFVLLTGCQCDQAAGFISNQRMISAMLVSETRSP